MLFADSTFGQSEVKVLCFLKHKVCVYCIFKAKPAVFVDINNRSARTDFEVDNESGSHKVYVGVIHCIDSTLFLFELDEQEWLFPSCLGVFGVLNISNFAELASKKVIDVFNVSPAAIKATDKNGVGNNFFALRVSVSLSLLSIKLLYLFAFQFANGLQIVFEVGY